MTPQHHFHIPDVRAANAAALDIARRVLPPSARTFSSCSSVSQAIAQLRPPPPAKGPRQQRQQQQRQQQQQQRIGVVTSPRAIREYDPVHPERIAFILVRASPPPQYMIVTNDRQLDVEHIVRFWLTSDAFDVRRTHADANEAGAGQSTECVVCSRSLLPRPRKRTMMAAEAAEDADDYEKAYSSSSSSDEEEYVEGAPHSRCFYCHVPLCEPCGDRLTTFDGCHRCPVCRQWKLNGGDFGVPFSSSGSSESESGTAVVGSNDESNPVDVLCDRVLSRLDGRVRIVPRIGDGFVVNRMSVIAKLARTDRYCPSDDDDDGVEDDEERVRIPHVRRDLKRILSDADGAPVHVWVRRKTYAIDAADERPVEEAAVFYVQQGRRLLQLRPDAWADVLGELLQDMRAAAAEKSAELWRELAAEGMRACGEEPSDADRAEVEEEAKQTTEKAAWAFTTRKVAYLPPHEFAFPSALREAVAAMMTSGTATVDRQTKEKQEEEQENGRPLATDHQAVASVSVEAEESTMEGDGPERRRRRNMGMSYGADRNGDPTTATIPFLAARFWVLVDAARAAGKPTAELTAVVVAPPYGIEGRRETRFTCVVGEDDVVSLRPAA